MPGEADFDSVFQHETGSPAYVQSGGEIPNEVALPSRALPSLDTALILLRGTCHRGRAQACRMLEGLANDGDARAAFEIGRVLQCGLGDIQPHPSIAIKWLQHALIGGVDRAAPLIVEVGLALGLGELANMAAAYERAVAPAHAPLRRRVRREMRPEAQRPEAATQTPVAAEGAWAQRKAARAESARQWRLSHTLP
jgi:hypothetical protein